MFREAKHGQIEPKWKESIAWKATAQSEVPKWENQGKEQVGEAYNWVADVSAIMFQEGNMVKSNVNERKTLDGK